MRLADWRAIYRGAPPALDPVARADVEAGLTALRAVLSREDTATPAEAEPASATVAELVQRNGDMLPPAVVRLTVALKLAAFGQGMSGVRWKVLRLMAGCLAADILPAVPARQPTDGRAFSFLFGLLTGTAEVAGAGRRRPAVKALREAGLRPLRLTAQEKRALLSGTELSTAFGLAGLFEAERVLQSAVVTSALSVAALGQPGAVLHPRLERLSRQPGRIAVAAALRDLLAGSVGGDPGADLAADVAAARRSQARLGTCLDLFRQAGESLERAGNAITEDRVVLWQSQEVLPGSAEPHALVLAVDLIGLALRELAGLAEQRIGLISSASGGEPGATAPQAMAAGFGAELREGPLALSTNLDGESAAPNAAQILRLAGTASLVIAVELLAAARALESRRTEASEPKAAAGPLAPVRALLRDSPVPANPDGGISAAELAGAADLVRSGALAAAAGIELPFVVGPSRSELAPRATAPLAAEARGNRP